MYLPDKNKIIGIDLGGTKVEAGLFQNNKILNKIYHLIPAGTDNPNEIIDIIADIIAELYDEKVSAIGIGVPSLVNREKGIVYNVQNIPSWKNIALSELLEKKFHIPVFLDNDANCYALGEHLFGAGKGYNNFVGLSIGTGMGAGIITEGHLLKDANCGSGEFGSIPYRDSIYEDYCSGKFFKKFYNTSGEDLYKKAKQGDKLAVNIFKEFGIHLGNAVKTIMFAVDPEKIIIGGSVASSNELFQESLYKTINSFPYPESTDNLEIIYSQTPNIAILGAASLCYNRINIET